MKESLLIFLLLLATTIINSEEDYLLTCSRPSSQPLRSPKFLKLKEKVIKNIPCDLTVQNYCNIPGELYPWHSVRRFVYENQGLIRRMYGEVRQLSVLRMEIDSRSSEVLSNAIDSDEDEETNSSRQFDVGVGVAVVGGATTKRAEESVSEKVDEDNETVGMTTENNIILENTTPQADEEITTDKNHIVYYADALAKTNNNISIPTASTADAEEEADEEEAAVVASADEIKPILKAVNACPVKEEVVAPYWANSTRGEILALLNLYPFEQYIHWEKCNQEHKQMFCRNGCRCEQQYRLHRLLAFDPTNECRGIFSDWFRFPSCCVCKCYLTEEEIASHYRRTDLPANSINNRSPRKLLNNEEEEAFSTFEEFEDQPDVIGIADLHTNQHFFYQRPR